MILACAFFGIGTSPMLRDERGDLVRRRMIGQPAADQVLHRSAAATGYMLERRSSLGLSIEPPASTTVPALKVADLAGQRVAGDQLEVVAVVLHVLDVVVQQQVQAADRRRGCTPGRQADLVDQQLGGVEHAGRLGEELVLAACRPASGRAGAGRAAFPGSRSPAASGLCRSARDDGLRRRAHRARLVHRVAGLRSSRPLARSCRTLRRKEVELPALDRGNQARTRRSTGRRSSAAASRR